MRILVVEDEQRIAVAIKEGLEQESYAVDVEHDGEAGLAAARADDYDLIILDLMLPGLDGQGTQKDKLDTYKAVTADPPKNIRFGWKNFYKMDPHTLSVKKTMKLSPKPWYVSYQ